MVFSDLLFVFLFLVLCYGAYFLAKTTQKRNIILLVFSLIFYAWGGPALVLLLCLMTFICWIGGIMISQSYERKSKRDWLDSVERKNNIRFSSVTDKNIKKFFLIATVTLCLAILFLFKYAGFAISTVYTVFGITKAVPDIALPIGISFYTFQLLSYVVDVYRGEVAAQRKYHLLLLYASLFHQCIAGPIVRYADVNFDIENRVIKTEEVSRGITRFAVGLAKKAILANGCGAICDRIFCDSAGNALDAAGIAALSGAAILLGGFCYMLQIYLDFAAYSDMAIGMGLMVGFHYKENFNYPYIADSVTDFWRRWHISLSSFFRDYVYIPLGGNRVSVPRHIFNMFAVWALTGIWHGANWNFILWGLYFFLFLVLEKYVIKPKKDPILPIRILRTVGTLAVIFVSFLIFKFSDMASLGEALLGIFNSNGVSFGDANTAMLLKNNIFFLAIASVACTPVIPAIQKLAAKTAVTARALKAVGVVIPVLLLLLSSFALAGDSYNPFMYFQF